MATIVKNDSSSMQETIKSYLSLNNQWSPYLSEKHAAVLKKCTETIAQACRDSDKIDVSRLTPAMKQLDIFKKRVDKRQVEINALKTFLELYESTRKQLENYRKTLKEAQSRDEDKNHPTQISKMQTIQSCINQYDEYICDLQKLATQTLKAFEERKFDKEVRRQYPKLVKELGLILKKAGLMQEVQNMPEHQIKQDLLLILQNDNAQVQNPNNEFNSFEWVLLLKGFFHRGAKKLLVTEKMVKAQEAKEEKVEALKKTLSNIPQFLSTLISSCEGKIIDYQSQKTTYEVIISALQDSKKPKSVERTEQEVITQLGTCIEYLSELKNIIQQTQKAFQKGGVREVIFAYPNMLTDLAKLLEKSNLSKKIEEDMPECFLKKDLRTIMNHQPFQMTTFVLQDWVASLMAFQGFGERFIFQISSSEEDICALAEKVDDAVSFSNKEKK